MSVKTWYLTLYLSPKFVLVNQASKMRIPIILVNGRMSDRAFSKYKKIRKSLSSLLSKYEHFYLKTEDDLKKYAYFLREESCKEKLSVGGDMKFDAPLIVSNQTEIDKLKDDLKINDRSFIFTAGSTRPGEEEMLADIYMNFQQKFPDFTMLIAPRHLERLNEIQTMLNKRDISWRFHDDASKNEKLVLVNRLGILNYLYNISNISFVGGTLVNIGGHNILEPVWAGCPVLYGPYIDNVREASDYIIRNDFGQKVESTNELKNIIEEFITNKISYKKKTSNDAGSSATRIAGKYILQKLKEL